MDKKIIKISLLQLLIMIIYLGITDYLFVISKYPNPVGIGILQWLLFIVQVIFTLILTIYFVRKESAKRYAKKRVAINVAIVSIFFMFYIVISNPILDWLWRLREH